MISTSFMRRAFAVAASLLALAGAAPATAQLTEQVRIINRLGYSNRDGEYQSPAIGGPNASIILPGDRPSQSSELGLEYTGTADNDGFFFLHNNYCVGTCSISTSTIIIFNVTNNGTEAVDLRFDSLITPGHLAFFNGANLGSDDGSATFAFDVLREDPGAEQELLYGASGFTNFRGLSLDTGGLDYNGLTLQSADDGSWQVYDWGATNLNLEAGRLEAGASTQIMYRATYQVNGTAVCTDLLICTGFQIAFGDPRNEGGSTGGAARMMAFAASAPEPVIGRIFDPFELTGTVVDATTPLPDAQSPFTAPTYGPTFVSRVGAVPEPATWLMMIAGFGLVGTASRRRRLLAA